MRLPHAAVLCLLVALPAWGGEDPAFSPWGETVSGLRCRASVPGTIEEDLPLQATIELECAPDGLENGVTRLRTAMAEAFLALELVHAKTGAKLEVRPEDPTGGLPLSFDTADTTAPPLDGSPLPRVRATFPLATAWVTSQMTTAGLTPGAYEGRIRLSYPGPEERWPAPRAEREAKGLWRGTVVSGAFPLTVEKQPARTRKLLVPKYLRLTENRRVVFAEEGAELIEIPARNGHFLLAELIRDGWRYRTANVPAPGDVLDDWQRHEGRVEATYRITIVQTPWPPDQIWRAGPRRGGSTYVEWKRDYAVRGAPVSTAALAEEEPLPAGALLGLGSTRFRHPSDIASVAASPDGKLVATASHGSTQGLVRVWETATGDLVREFETSTSTLEFSPDGSRLATVDSLMSATVRDVASGEGDASVPMVPWPGDAIGGTTGLQSGISCVRFSPDGKRLALGGWGAESFFFADDRKSETVHRQLSLVELATGREIRHFGHEASVADADFSPDGSLLASVDRETVRLWEVGTGKLRWAATHWQWQRPTGVRFTPDGRQLLVAAGSGLGVLDPATGKEIFFRSGLGGSAEIAVRRDGALVAVAAWKTIRLFDPATWKQVGEFRGAVGGVSSLAFAGDLLFASGGHIARLFDPKWGRQLLRTRFHEEAVDTLLFAPDGKTLLSGSHDVTLRFWDPTTGALRRLMRDFHSRLHAVAVSPDGKTMATADYLGVKLRDAATGKVRGEVRAGLAARSLAFSPDGGTLAIGGDHGSVVLWDLAAGKVRHREELPADQRGHLVSLAFSPDGSVLAVGPQNALVYLVDPAGKELSRVVKPGYWPLYKSQLSFSPDGASLLCVGSRAVVVDTTTWEVRRELETDPSGRANGIGAWSPDGRTIATATGEGPVRLWDAADGKAVGAFDGHDGRVTRLAFSPDGKRLATGGADTAVMVWEVPSR